MAGWPRWGKIQAKAQAADNRAEVEEGRRQCRYKELAFGVKDAHHHGCQRHAEQEGEHDPGELDREFGLARDALEVRGQQVDDGFGPVHSDQGEDADQEGKKHQDIAGQSPGGLGAAVGAVVGEHGDKGGG
jgi:hypothetical protein